MKNNLVLPLLAVLVVVLVALFSYKMASYKNPTKTYEKEITRIETTSDSDEVDSIEEDLEATDVESIDTELTQIEAELN